MDWATSKRSLTKQEQFDEIQDEVSVLKLFCEAYDAGKMEVVPKMAASIVGLMLNEGRDRQRLSPINRFGYTPKFLNSMRPVDHANLLPEYTGISINMSQKDGAPLYEFVPTFKSSSPDTFSRWVSQTHWWDDPIIKTGHELGNKTVSRFKLLKQYRDQRGGAHMDPTVEAIFEHIHSTMGLHFVGNKGQETTPTMSIAQAVVRQIGHEALQSLEQFRTTVVIT